MTDDHKTGGVENAGLENDGRLLRTVTWGL